MLAYAQYTRVSAQVLDPNGTPYKSGSWQATLNVSGVTPGFPVTFQGNPNFQTSYQGQLDVNGNLAVTLPDNNVITPTGQTQWNFQFCQSAFPPTAPCGNLTILITGSTMSITTQVRAIPLPVVVGAGITLPATLTAPGVFTNTQQNENLAVVINGPCPQSTIIEKTTIVTDAVSGCMIIPATGVTNGFSNAGAFYTQNNNPNSTGQFGKVEGVGVYPVCMDNANNTLCIGSAPQVEDVAGETGTFIEGEEVAVIPQNTTTNGTGTLYSLEGGNVQPTGNLLPAIHIQTPAGTATWTNGLWCDQSSIVATSINSTAIAPCVHLGLEAAGNSAISEALSFDANNGSGVLTPISLISLVDANNIPVLTTVSATGKDYIWTRFRLVSFTVASLPTSVPVGFTVMVSDATTFTVGTCTGGGSDEMIAIWNGSAWICH